MKSNSNPQWCDISIVQYDSTDDYRLSPSALFVINNIASSLCKTAGSNFSPFTNNLKNKVKELAWFQDQNDNAFFKSKFQLNASDLTILKNDILDCLIGDYPGIGPACEKAFKSAFSAKKPRNPGAFFTPECTEQSWSEARFTNWNDLKFANYPKKQWAPGIPNLVQIHLSDVLLDETDDSSVQLADLHPFLEPLASSPSIGLICTNQPKDLAKVVSRANGLPPNLCVLTCISGPDHDGLQRVEELKSINATTRGILIEPMISKMPPELLNLDGIHWVIVSGQSGNTHEAAPFELSWAEDLRDHCKEKGVAFFLNQIPFGVDWDEWDQALKIREYPEIFRSHTVPVVESKQDAILLVSGSCENNKANKLIEVEIVTTASLESEFQRLDKIVREGIKNFVSAGKALVEIKNNDLWKESFKNWPAYCLSIKGLGRSDAYRYIKAGKIVIELANQSPIGDKSSIPMPTAEAQLRSLGLLKDQSQWYPAWSKAVSMADGNVPTAEQVEVVVNEIRYPDGRPKPQDTPKQKRNQLIDLLINAITEKGLLAEFNDILMELKSAS